jgi:hypothetical protein
MLLKDLADIAQIVSAVTVIVSLVYVALQVRQGTIELRVATQQSLSDSHSDLLIQCAFNPDFSRIVLAASSEDGVNREDQLRLSSLLIAFFLQFQADFYSQVTGASAPDWWGHQRIATGRWLAYPAIRQWWRADRELFSEAFRSVIDQDVARLDVQQP